MSATDKLRRLLDERGVEWESKDVEGVSDFHDTRWNAYDVQWCYVEFVGNNYTKLKPSSEFHCTPEQAIAATLGSKFNPDGLPVGLTISDDGNLLNWRGENYVKQSTLGSGTLTVEQVREAIRKYAHDDSCYIFEVYGEMCGPIADELNATLGIGECEIETTESWLPAERYHRCKICGAFFAVNVCPNCGAKVVSA